MNDRWQVLEGDCRDAMRLMLDDNSVDSIVTDPPYGLDFMGKEWDHGVPGVEFWEEALRIAKPGAHLVAFGGTRTYHRLTCAIEDAGWEIRDCLSWLYGSGFPKSRDISKDIDKTLGAAREIVGVQQAPGHAKANVEQGAQTRTHLEFPKYSGTAVTDAAKQWDGWGTALKPAWEPIILARKPFKATVAENVQRWRTGALNIDGCRIGTDDNRQRVNSGSKGGDGTYGTSKTYTNENHPSGRWPANLILDEEAGALLDEQSGIQKSGVAYEPKGKQKPHSVYGDMGTLGRTLGYGDKGGASRFFYCAKASQKERNYGLPEGERNTHPTVKPVALMQWLCRMVTPPGGLILDPFMGSGSTGVAALAEGFRFFGVDLGAEHVAIARQRLGAAT